MKSLAIIRIQPDAFGSIASGTGKQLAELLRAIQTVRPNRNWSGADLEMTGAVQLGLRAKDTVPEFLAEISELIPRVDEVEQFQSGVFVGIPPSSKAPSFREGGLWTEDKDAADLADSLIEIRAFDTTCWLIATTDAEFAESLSRRFATMIADDDREGSGE